MTSKKTILGIMLAVICLCSSCLSNDDETVTYDDTAVTSFTLGKVKCYRTVTTPSGKDSTYSYTYTASSIPVYIDHVNKRIYNEDSLTVGTDLSRMLVTITTKNNGIAFLKDLSTGAWNMYSSIDSIDFSEPRVLRVVSSDGNHTADYTVDLVCHQEYADSFSWTRMPSNSKIATFTKMKGVQAGSVMYLLGADAAGVISLLRSANGEEWTDCTLPATDMSGASIASVNGVLKVYVGGLLYSTTDGDAWSNVTPDVTLKSVIGGCASEMYAVGTSGTIMVSVDGGTTWAKDNMESDEYVDNTKYLPASDISVLTSATKTNSDVTRVVMIGGTEYKGSGDTFANSVVWNKIVDPISPQVWTYTNIAWDNYNYTLPRMEGVSAVMYADGIVAMGGKPINNTVKAYSKLYYSPDCGATWHTLAGMRVPESFKTMKAATLITDDKGFFYLVGSNADAETMKEKCVIWRAKQNKVLWKDSNKYFE